MNCYPRIEQIELWRMIRGRPCLHQTYSTVSLWSFLISRPMLRRRLLLWLSGPIQSTTYYRHFEWFVPWNTSCWLRSQFPSPCGDVVPSPMVVEAVHPPHPGPYCTNTHTSMYGSIQSLKWLIPSEAFLAVWLINQLFLVDTILILTCYGGTPCSLTERGNGARRGWYNFLRTDCTLVKANESSVYHAG